MTTLPLSHPWQRELEVAVPLVRTVADEVRRIYDAQSAGTYTKGDGSPVTDADLTADQLLREGLTRSFPGDALLTEEFEDDPSRLERQRCWIADPIDGTAQFVARTGNFDVLLALVVDGRSEVSICGHPPSGTMTIAIRGYGAWVVDAAGNTRRHRIDRPTEPPVLVTSKYYAPDEYPGALATLTETLGTDPLEILPVGYGPRSFLPGWRSYDAFVGFWRGDGGSPVREWDLAATDLLTTEAGGEFTDLYGNRYAYNQPSPRPRTGILASASPGLHERILETLQPYLPARDPAPAETALPAK